MGWSDVLAFTESALFVSALIEVSKASSCQDHRDKTQRGNMRDLLFNDTE